MGNIITSLQTNQKKEAGGGGAGTVNAADNGLSLFNPATVVMGNDLGDPAAPAQLLDNREIFMGNNSMFWTVDAIFNAGRFMGWGLNPFTDTGGFVVSEDLTNWPFPANQRLGYIIQANNERGSQTMAWARTRANDGFQFDNAGYAPGGGAGMRIFDTDDIQFQPDDSFTDQGFGYAFDSRGRTTAFINPAVSDFIINPSSPRVALNSHSGWINDFNQIIINDDLNGGTLSMRGYGDGSGNWGNLWFETTGAATDAGLWFTPGGNIQVNRSATPSPDEGSAFQIYGELFLDVPYNTIAGDQSEVLGWSTTTHRVNKFVVENGMWQDDGNGDIVLGNDSGDPAQPAQLLNDREIPMRSFSIALTQGGGGSAKTAFLRQGSLQVQDNADPNLFGILFSDQLSISDNTSGHNAGAQVLATVPTLFASGPASTTHFSDLAGQINSAQAQKGTFDIVGTLTTVDADAGGTTLSDTWELGSVVAGAVALDAANSVHVRINGVLVKLLKAA